MIFQNAANKNPYKLTQKSIKDIKNVTQGTTFKQWYFNACILTHPQTMIIQQQIRQAIFVFQERKLQEVLVVILCQAAVRRYCNSLKPFKKFKIINGIIKTSHLSNNFVFITEESEMIQIKTQVQQKQKPSSVIQKIFASRNNKSKKQQKQQQKKTSVSLSIPNVSIINESDDQSSKNSFYTNQNIKSQKIIDRNSCKTEKNIEQLVTFCGKVISIYEVGKGKMNHGIGYKIEQCFSMVTYEVVVWCEMQYDYLKKGRTYEFKNFRPHKKQNLQISYHSHPQMSIIQELIDF